MTDEEREVIINTLRERVVDRELSDQEIERMVERLERMAGKGRVYDWMFQDVVRGLKFT